MEMKMTTKLAAVILCSLVFAVSANAGVITTVGASNATSWNATPTLGTATPGASSTQNAGASPVAQTITVGASSLTLDKLAFVVNTTTNYSATMTLSIFAVADPLAQGFNKNTANLLPGGGSFTFASATSTTNGILTLDLTGTDEITLAANTSYVLQMTKVSATSNPAFRYFTATDNASSAYTGGAFYYNSNYVTNSGSDAAFAVFAVPEPATVSLLVLGGLGALLRRKRA
ncbi:MAG TPA: hypothetical protein DCX07_06350 [Phycisphaerales bacterium]|nr:hypothetical protein [Phycisphaerales bacterium]